MAQKKTWSSQVEEYVKLGLHLLFQRKQPMKLTEFKEWLEKESKIENFITEPTLSRYLSNKMGISQTKGEILLKIIDSELEIEKILMDRIKEFSKDNWSSINTRVILTDIVLLTFVVMKKITDRSDDLNNINAIVTPEADGIPLGVILAQQLKCKCIYVRKNKRSEDTEFVSVEAQRYRNVVNYYLSLKELPPNSNVLLVDDIKRSGSTLKHLEELVKKAGSHVSKKMVLIDIETKNQQISDVESFLKLNSILNP